MRIVTSSELPHRENAIRCSPSGGNAMQLAILRCSLFITMLLAGQTGVGAQDAGKHAITFDDMIQMHRVGEAQVSPDGKWVVYSVSTPDMDANRGASNIWIVPTNGGAPLQLTQSGQDSSPVWSPDGKTIAFLSSRSSDSQVYLLSMDGGEAKPLTHISTGVDLAKWSPDGKTILLTSGVYPDCKDDTCNSKRDAEREKDKVKAHVAEHLLYRHWTHWNDGKRSHLFVVPTNGSAPPRDLTPGADYDVPPDQRGGPGDLNFSPDSKEICFTAVTDPVEAISTNGDLFVVPVAGGEIKRVTTQRGFDGGPVYSPDGKYIAYHAQLVPEDESDRWRVMLYDRATQEIENLSEGFDRSASDLFWSPDSKTIYFSAEDETQQPIYAMTPRAGAEPKKVIANTYNLSVSLSGDGKTLAFERTNLSTPTEVFAASSDGSGVRQLTHHNDAILASLKMNEAETFWFEGAGGTKVQA